MTPSKLVAVVTMGLLGPIPSPTLQSHHEAMMEEWVVIMTQPSVSSVEADNTPPSSAVTTPPEDTSPSPAEASPSSVDWDALAQCESTGDWSINTGNGYYGGLQFSLNSWQWVGGTGYPHEHSRETQIAMAEELLARQGLGAWPACTRKLGWR